MGCGLSVPKSRFGARAGQAPRSARSSTEEKVRFGGTAGQPPMPARPHQPKYRRRSSDERVGMSMSKGDYAGMEGGNGFSGFGGVKEPSRGWA